MKTKIIEMNFFTGKFFGYSILIYVIGVALFSFLLPEMSKQILFSGTLTFINTIIGFYFIDLGLSKSQNKFFAIVFGSFGARLLLMLLSVFLAVVFLKLPKIEMLISLFVFYVLFLILEIFYLSSKVKK